MLRKADIVVDVVACNSSNNNGGWWEGSLGDRRGPHGRFRRDFACTLDDGEVVKNIGDWWFSESGLLADAGGMVWVGPKWERKEPVRVRSERWAEAF